MNPYQPRPQIIKFGGSNQKSPEDDQKIYETLQDLASKSKVAAVFSARYGKSNSLLARVLGIPNINTQKITNSNLNRLLRSDTLPAEVETKLREQYDNPTIARMLLTGEYEAVRAHLGKLAHEHDVDSRLQHYTDFPIIAKDTSTYLTGEIDLKASKKQIKQFPLNRRITLIAGYAATSPNHPNIGVPVLLGRDASDLVAAALAQITDGYLHLAKDVNGIRYDPQDENSTIERVSREELMNLPSLPIHPTVLELYDGEIRVGGFHPDEAQTVIRHKTYRTIIPVNTAPQKYRDGPVAAR